PNLPAWEGKVSSSQLEHALGFPVNLANDADMAALGEHRFGAGRGVSDLLYMTSSTGVGAGVIAGGRLLHGRWSMAEAGHIVIDWKRRETLEWLGSGSTLARLSGHPGPVLEELISHGDQEAAAIFDEVASAFAVGVHNLVHCFMPERVVIGGGVSRSGERLLGPIRNQLDECNDGCPIDGHDVFVAAAGDDVGLMGAFAYALELSAAADSSR
ncbi:MAG: ROK family protein, partial [Candidatus Obscuribacterales bacterium]